MTAPTTTATSNPCPAPHCPRKLRHAEILCSRHWFKVPMVLRDQVWTRRRALEKDPANKAKYEAWRAAAENAIEALL